MANTSAILDIVILDTHSDLYLAIGDASWYATGFNVTVPSISITPPGCTTTTVSFVPKGVQVYNSYTLGLTSDPATCNFMSLPDGLYTIIYSIYPSQTYSVTKNFLRVDRLYTLVDAAFLKLDMMVCDESLKKQLKDQIDLIEFYIQGAIAAANNCSLNLATQLYTKALNLTNSFVNSQNCCN